MSPSENSGIERVGDGLQDVLTVLLTAGEGVLLIGFLLFAAGTFAARRGRHSRIERIAEPFAEIPAAKLWIASLTLVLLSVLHLVVADTAIPLAVGAATAVIGAPIVLHSFTGNPHRDYADSGSVTLDPVADRGNAYGSLTGADFWDQDAGGYVGDAADLVDAIVARRAALFVSRQKIDDRVPIIVAFTEAHGDQVRSGIYRYDTNYPTVDAPHRDLPYTPNKHGANPPTLVAILALHDSDPEDAADIAHRHQEEADALQAQALALTLEPPFSAVAAPWATRALERDRSPQLLAAAEETALHLHRSDARRSADTVARALRVDHKDNRR